MRNETAQQLIRWESFRAQMRKRRLGLGLTQGQVSKRMGRSQDFVAILENSTRSIPNLTTVWLWIEALDGFMRIEWDSNES